MDPASRILTGSPDEAADDETFTISATTSTDAARSSSATPPTCGVLDI